MGVTGWVVVGVLAALGLGIGLWAVAIHNALVELRHNMAEAWANISLSLKQRHEEIGRLAEVVARYVAHETATVQAVLDHRAAADRALDAADPGRLDREEGRLSAAVGGLMALAEAYPELKADRVFSDLAERVSGLEGQVTDRREFYNETVNLYNVRLSQLPDMAVARVMGLQPAALLAFSADETPAPDLSALRGLGAGTPS